MISKKNRLTEREVKKVLNRGKPFFSYGIVLNYMKNTIQKNRFAIIIGSKSVNTNVTRNVFRRKFYDLVKPKLEYNKGIDYVFVVKKKTKLDKIDNTIIKSFEKEIKFLLNKI